MTDDMKAAVRTFACPLWYARQDGYKEVPSGFTGRMACSPVLWSLMWTCPHFRYRSVCWECYDAMQAAEVAIAKANADALIRDAAPKMLAALEYREENVTLRSVAIVLKGKGMHHTAAFLRTKADAEDAAIKKARGLK